MHAGQEVHRRKGNHRAEHQHLAMGEVDQVENAVNHGVAERDQCIDRADHQAVYQLLQKNIQNRLLRRVWGIKE